MELKMCADETKTKGLLDILEKLLDQEQTNVEQLFQYVRLDSRLGWEPSMGYVCDEWHLQWKLRQLASVRVFLKQYRTMVL